MKISIVKDLSTHKIVEIALDEKKAESYFTKAAKVLSKTHPVKGFRPGSAPYEIVEKTLGRSACLNETLTIVIADLLPLVLRTQKEAFVSTPRIECVSCEKGKPLIFTVTLARKPNVVLPDYRAIHVEGEKSTVSENDVDEALQYIAKSRNTAAIDDTFARSLGSFENLDSLRESIKEGILYEKTQQEQARARHHLLEKIRASSTIDIAPFLIEDEAEHLGKEGGLGDKENVKDKEKLKEAARMRLEHTLILQEISQKEQIKVSEGEVEERVKSILSRARSPRHANQAFNPEHLTHHVRQQVLQEKVFREVLDKQIRLN
ncbi:MAG: hypothetical protein HYZ69_00065 [Candidatus Colwellbacteria bacterium]|nr:hypothetical protein [Candidatus Colwellbacteria bacterium]